MADEMMVKELEEVVVRFSGDSGDGMQLAGNETSPEAAVAWATQRLKDKLHVSLGSFGASILRLWCFSKISMSNPAAARTGATSFNVFMRRLIPMDIFAERRTASTLLASFTWFN